MTGSAIERAGDLKGNKDEDEKRFYISGASSGGPDY
jgi:hypothetical protein